MQNRYLIDNLESEVSSRTRQLDDLLQKFKEANLRLDEQNKLLSEIAVTDGLTGLYNHAALHENLCEVFTMAEQQQFDLSVVMIDVDNFKMLNDSYGHQIGDAVLVSFAELLREQLRPNDVKIKYYNENEAGDNDRDGLGGRYGGDEFVLILPRCGAEQADIVGNRLAERIHSLKIEGAPDVYITASIGIAVLEGAADCDDPKELIALADKALYVSKKEGRDRMTLLVYGRDTAGS